MTSTPRIIDVRAVGLAVAAMAAFLTTTCALALALAPDTTTGIASTLFHLDLGTTSRRMGWGVFLGSLVGWSLGAGLTASGVAAVYNRLARLAPPMP